MRPGCTSDRRSVSSVNWTRGVRRSPATTALSRHPGGDGARVPVSGSTRKGGRRISVGYVAARICPLKVVATHNSVCSVNIGVLRRLFYRGRHAYDAVRDGFAGLLPVSASRLSGTGGTRSQASGGRSPSTAARPSVASSRRRLLWAWLYRIWPRCLKVLVQVKPATVILSLVKT